MQSDNLNSARHEERHLHIPPNDLVQRTPEENGTMLRDRRELMGNASVEAAKRIDQLIDMAAQGLARMGTDDGFAHTLRAVRTHSRWNDQIEGKSLRYTAIVLLGLSHDDGALEGLALNGRSAVELSQICVKRAEMSDDTGALALVAWAAAETGGFMAAGLLENLLVRLKTDRPLDTVDCAWTLTAALASAPYGDTRELASLARELLIQGQSGSGIFPHTLRTATHMRSHIGCFADQIYPIQALSRLHAAGGDEDALSRAESCAARICALQGRDGQWWWHYDLRDGSVVEGYPVYSVHQHGMGPMGLLELKEAGGTDYTQSVLKGLRWIYEHPEVPEALVIPDKGIVWRKVARREPNKLVRALAGTTTWLSRGFRLPALDVLFPPSRVDHECRPYELGWLLYAWLPGAAMTTRKATSPDQGTVVSREI
jgi:hypothetical protein